MAGMRVRGFLSTGGDRRGGGKVQPLRWELVVGGLWIAIGVKNRRQKSD